MSTVFVSQIIYFSKPFSSKKCNIKLLSSHSQVVYQIPARYYLRVRNFLQVILRNNTKQGFKINRIYFITGAS